MTDKKDGHDRPNESKQTDDLVVGLDEWPMTKGWIVRYLNPAPSLRAVRHRLRLVRRLPPNVDRWPELTLLLTCLA